MDQLVDAPLVVFDPAASGPDLDGPCAREQLSTEVLPGEDMVPDGHRVHTLAPSTDVNVSDGHTLHVFAVTAAFTAENLPAKQGLQFPAPIASLYVPARHGTLS